MGLLGAIFGGDKTESSTQKTTYDPRLGRIQGMNEQILKRINSTPFQGYDPNSRVAMQDPALMNRLNGVYGGAADQGQFGFDMMRGAMGTAQDWNAYMNPYESQVVDATNQQYDQSMDRGMNAINSRFASMGGIKNSRLNNAYGQLAADIGSQRANTIGNLRYQGFNNAQNYAQQMGQTQFNMGQGLSNLGFTGAQGLQGIGEYQRNLAQQQNNARYEEFMRRQQDPYQRLNAGIAAQQGPWATTQTGQTKTNDGGGLLGKVIGGVSSIAGLGNPLQMLGLGGGSEGAPQGGSTGIGVQGSFGAPQFGGIGVQGSFGAPQFGGIGVQGSFGYNPFGGYQP